MNLTSGNRPLRWGLLVLGVVLVFLLAVMVVEPDSSGDSVLYQGMAREYGSSRVTPGGEGCFERGFILQGLSRGSRLDQLEAGRASVRLAAPFLSSLILPFLPQQDPAAQRRFRSYTTTEKRSTYCGRVVSADSRAGQRCPHCGVFWSKETKHFSERRRNQ